MQDCNRTAISITPCEFPFATEQCPIGYTSTDCINFAGQDDQLTGVINGEYLTITLNKLVEFVRLRTVNSINSGTLEVQKIDNNNGVNFGIEVKVSADAQNQLTIGTDGALYAIPYSGELISDTNTINLFRDNTNNAIKADVRYVQSSTINLSSTPSGLKADITQALMNRITTLEQKVAQLENQ